MFPYEDPSGLLDLLAKRTGDGLTLKRANASPARELTLPDEMRARFERTYGLGSRLHPSLRRDGLVAPEFRSTPMQPTCG